MHYAHTGKNPDKSDWEPLSKHLADAMRLATAFAAVFGAGALAGAMGALHDVGKATEAFLRYLEGRGPSPDHSTAGAVIALRRYGPVLGKMAAFGVAGHHAGLANGARTGSGLRSLLERTQGAPSPTLPADCDIAAPAAAALALRAPVGAPGFSRDFSAAFLIRMLFSCLVDADRLATEAYDAALHGRTVERGWKGDLTVLRHRLLDRLEALRAEGKPVDGVRRDILAAVRERAAVEEPGLFSLTVPTGGGKTLASLAFALDHAIRHGLRRVIYVIPYMSVAEQTADVFRAALKDDDAILEHHSAFDVEKFVKDRKASGNNGDDDEGAAGIAKLRRAAENWDRPIVVATAVQFFDSLYANRTSKCRKLHNIAGSVVVLDEAQTIPLPVLRPCLAAIQELARGYKTSVVLCTATQPAVRVEDGFKGGLTGVRELAPNPAALYEKLKRATVTQLPDPLTDDDLAARLVAAGSALCIVNSRRHARELYELTAKTTNAPGVAHHLSTCMCAVHRRRKLAEIKRRLKDGLPTVVVATSLVEAGVDFDFPVVYRAKAGLESIVQAAGRCNRDGELPEPGRTFVFQPAPGEGRAPPREMAQFAAAAEEAFRNYPDPTTPAALQAYFKALYWLRGEEELDALKLEDGEKGVLRSLKKRADRLEFDFADIGAAFRLIDSPQVPVIVPDPVNETEVQGLVAALRGHGPSSGSIGGLARKLQPYLVQIPRNARSRLLATGAAEAIRPDEFGDQFIWLTNHALYTDAAGLDWRDPTFMEATSTIF